MEHMLIVNLDPDMSPSAVEELKYAISMRRGVRGVEWQEAAQQSAEPTGSHAGKIPQHKPTNYIGGSEM